MKYLGWKLVSVFVIFLAIFVSIQASSLSLHEPETTIKTIVEETLVKKNTTTVEGSSTIAGATCSCDNTESPVCGSNGVTYKNSCRFDCTKKRVKRLRIVKNGQCNGLTLNQYRATQPRG